MQDVVRTGQRLSGGTPGRRGAVGVIVTDGAEMFAVVSVLAVAGYDEPAFVDVGAHRACVGRMTSLDGPEAGGDHQDVTRLLGLIRLDLDIAVDARVGDLSGLPVCASVSEALGSAVALCGRNGVRPLGPVQAIGATVSVVSPDDAGVRWFEGAVEIGYGADAPVLAVGDAGSLILCQDRPFAVVVGANSRSIVAAPLADVLAAGRLFPIDEVQARRRDHQVRLAAMARRATEEAGPDGGSNRLLVRRSSMAQETQERERALLDWVRRPAA